MGKGPVTNRGQFGHQRRCDTAVDDVQAINEILHKFGAGIADTPQERRAALEELRRDRNPLEPTPTVTLRSGGDQWESPSDSDSEIDLDTDVAVPLPDSDGNYNEQELDDYYSRASGTTTDDVDA